MKERKEEKWYIRNSRNGRSVTKSRAEGDGERNNNVQSCT